MEFGLLKFEENQSSFPLKIRVEHFHSDYIIRNHSTFTQNPRHARLIQKNMDWCILVCENQII